MDNKDWLTYDEAQEYLGIKRSTLQAMTNELGIQTRKFRFDKRRYIARVDVEKMKRLRERPWTADERQPKESVA